MNKRKNQKFDEVVKALSLLGLGVLMLATASLAIIFALVSISEGETAMIPFVVWCVCSFFGSAYSFGYINGDMKNTFRVLGIICGAVASLVLLVLMLVAPSFGGKSGFIVFARAFVLVAIALFIVGTKLKIKPLRVIPPIVVGVFLLIVVSAARHLFL